MIEQACITELGINDAPAHKEDINHKYNSLANDFISKGDNKNLVFPVEPNRMNERLAIQQGLFLFPSNPGASFQTNLAAIFKADTNIFKNRAAVDYDSKIHTQEELKKTGVLKIVVPSYLKESILRDLWKMNVSSATLFPGIDGFTRSLNYHLM